MKTVITKAQKQELVNEILNGLQEMVEKIIDNKFDVEEVVVKKEKATKQSNFDKKLSAEEIENRCKLAFKRGYIVVGEQVISRFGKVIRTDINGALGMQFKENGEYVIIPLQKYYIEYFNSLQNATTEEEIATTEEATTEKEATTPLSNDDRTKQFVDMLLRLNIEKSKIPEFTAEKPNSDIMTADELTVDYGLIF